MQAQAYARTNPAPHLSPHIHFPFLQAERTARVRETMVCLSAGSNMGRKHGGAGLEGKRLGGQ